MYTYNPVEGIFLMIGGKYSGYNMKQLNIIIILSFILNAQTNDRLRRLKIISTKLVCRNLKFALLQARGFSDSQIDAVIEKTNKNKINFLMS